VSDIFIEFDQSKSLLQFL